MSKKLGLLFVSAAALSASGCASIPDDRGMSDVRGLISARGGPNLPTTAETGASLALSGKALSVQDAVQIALTHNPRLRKGYAQLGFAGAEIYQAGRLSNPRLSLTVLDPSGIGLANQITIGLAQNFTELLMLPARSRIAEGEFERAKALVGADVLRLAAQVEAAYYSLVGAQQVAAMRTAIAKAARASADLSQRYYDAGNITELQVRLQQATASQSELDLLSAQAEVTHARSQLNTLLGLTEDDGKWVVPDRLPMPATEEDDPADLQRLATANRLDLAAARKEVELARSGFKLTRRFRFIGDMEVGVEHERDTDRTRMTGPTLTWAVPLFNQNQAGVLRATSELESSQAELRELEIDASNEIQLASQRVLNTRAKIYEFRKNLLPLREEIVARMQERVNYMLDGVFDLLRLKQEEYGAYEGYLEAVRDYWKARAELGRLVGTQLPSTARITNGTIGPELPEQSDQAGGAMDGMDMGGMDMGGMDHSSGAMKSKLGSSTHANPGQMMPGMDMGEMEGMAHAPTATPSISTKPAGNSPSDSMPGMDMSGMKGMDHSTPTATVSHAAACEQAKNGNMDDPLVRALAQKCREQEPSVGPGALPASPDDHPTTHSDQQTQPPAGSPDGDGSSPHGDHQH